MPFVNNCIFFFSLNTWITGKVSVLFVVSVVLKSCEVSGENGISHPGEPYNSSL